MPGIIARLTSRLRHIDAEPDELVEDAYLLLKRAERADGVWLEMSAYTGMASVKMQLAAYLKEHRG